MSMYLETDEDRKRIAVHVPDEGVLGPAMRALPTDRMRAFVIALHEHALAGEESRVRAAESAGYRGTPNGLAVTAYRLTHDEKVQAAIIEEGRRRMGSLVPLAMVRMKEVLLSGSKKEWMKAADMLFDRVGLPRTTQHEVTTERKYSDEEKIARIVFIAEKLGLDPKTLLGNKAPAAKVLNQPDAVDAEFEEVFDPSEFNPVEGEDD